jgi:hypothetical protein
MMQPVLACDVTVTRIEWIRLNVDDALARNERHGRCIECHKSAGAHRRSANGGQAPLVEHLEAKPKRSLSGNFVEEFQSGCGVGV